jgi:hypothetical protein
MILRALKFPFYLSLGFFAIMLSAFIGVYNIYNKQK